MDPAANANTSRRPVVKTIDLDRQQCDFHRWMVAQNEDAGLAVDHVLFKTERDPDLLAALKGCEVPVEGVSQ